MNTLKRLRRTAAFLFVLIALVVAGITPKVAAAGVTSAAGQVTATGNLNVRSAASTSSTIISKLPSGTYVTLIWKSGGWWYVEYAPSQYGYVSADYIRYVYGTYALQASTSSGNLNVRSGPGTSYAVTGSVVNGACVLVLSESDGWYKIVYNGSGTGYISGQFTSSMMAWPVPASNKINQYFSSTHTGLDIGASVQGVSGDNVIAAMGGKVVYAGILSGYGYVVYIDSIYNGQPIQTRYAHLESAPLVSAGSYVGAGQLIGYMGSTGTSTGVHLHFEVRIRSSSADCLANADSTSVNPVNYV